MRKGKVSIKGNDVKIEIEDLGWMDFVAAFEGKLPYVRVGIVGSTKKNRYDIDAEEDGKPRTSKEAKKAIIEARKKEFLPTSQTNVSIGAIHEFGGDTTLPNGKKITLPQRSFLRYPISSKLYSYMKERGAFKEGIIEKVIENGNFVLFMRKVGATAKAIVEDAFDSEGFGTWEKSNREFKKLDMTLVETQQLRNSISYVVKN